MSKTPLRRDLKFDDFDDVKAEVNRLLESGYTQNGKWNLAQTSAHLVEWMRYPMDGYPRPPLPMRVIFWLMKMTVAKGMVRKILANGFSPGMPTAPDTVFKPDILNDNDAATKLFETIDRLCSHKGALHASPLFGDSDMATLQRVQLLHCAHHLGFLQPKV